MKTIALIAVAGLASVASAQLGGSASVVFSADKATAVTGEDVTWTVSIDWAATAADVYVAGLNLDFASGLAGTGGAFTGSALIAGDANMTLTPPTASGADYAGLLYTDLATLSTGRPGGGADPFEIGSFTVQYGGAGAASYGATSIAGQDGLSLAQGAFFTLVTQVIAFDVVTDTVDVTVIPAPASLAIVGLGGLVAVRRRR